MEDRTAAGLFRARADVPLSANVIEIREHIEYEHKRGFWGLVTRALFSWPNLWFMFTYRKLATRWALRHRIK